jgi:hypothetical protein
MSSTPDLRVFAGRRVSNPPKPSLDGAPAGEFTVRATLSRKKLIVIAVGGFCLCEMIDWTGITGKHFPRSGGEALAQAFVNILWVALFMGTSLFMTSRSGE